MWFYAQGFVTNFYFVNLFYYYSLFLLLYLPIYSNNVSTLLCSTSIFACFFSLKSMYPFFSLSLFFFYSSLSLILFLSKTFYFGAFSFSIFFAFVGFASDAKTSLDNTISLSPLPFSLSLSLSLSFLSPTHFISLSCVQFNLQTPQRRWSYFLPNYFVRISSDGQRPLLCWRWIITWFLISFFINPIPPSFL